MTDFDELHFPTAPVTDSDPIIAEIDLDNCDTAGLVSVHLSDAPKVADLLELAKRSYAQRAYEFASYEKGWFGDDLPQRVTRYIDNGHAAEGDPLTYVLDHLAAIRAIEPGWTP